MKKGSIVIRVDGDEKIGLGHAMRSLSLAIYLQKKYFIKLAYRSMTGEVLALFEKQKIPCFKLEKEQVHDAVILKEQVTDLQVVVFDGYQFNDDYYSEYKKLGIKVALIDDLAVSFNTADLILNHSPGATIDSYKSNTTAIKCMGLKYALIQKCFYRNANYEKKSINKIFVNMGGSDPQNISQLVIERLLNNLNVKEVCIVLGPANTHGKKIEELAKGNKKVKIFRGLSSLELANLMFECDLGFTTASTIAVEASAAKLPLVVGHTVDNHKNYYEGLISQNLALGVESYLDQDLGRKIDKIFSEMNFDLINSLQKKQVEVFNDKAEDRILDAFDQLLAKKIGLCIGGNLGIASMDKIIEKYSVSFVFTNADTYQVLIKMDKYKEIPKFYGNPRKGNGLNFLKSQEIFQVDLLFSINYQYLLEKDMLSFPRITALNIHGSLLPKYRGRTPLIWAIINGEKETGMTVHIIDDHCDTGPIVNQKSVKIPEQATGAEMVKLYEEIYPQFILETIDQVLSGEYSKNVQIEADATYFGKRTPEDGLIDWCWDSKRIYNWVRALAPPYPGAFTYYHGKKLIIQQVDAANIEQKNNGSPGDIVFVENNLPVIRTGDGLLKITKISTLDKIAFISKTKLTKGIEVILLDQVMMKKQANNLVKLISSWELSQWKEENFLYDLPLKWEYSFMLQEDENILGFCIASGKIDHNYYIHLFFCDEKIRGKGVGKLLLNTAEKIAKSRKLQAIILRCPIINDGAVKFYKKQGFQILEEVLDAVSGEIPDYILKKQLI